MDRKRLVICGECVLALTRRAPADTVRTTAIAQHIRSLRTKSTAQRPRDGPRTRLHTQGRAIRSASTSTTRSTTVSLRPHEEHDLSALHSRIQELSASILKPTDGPVPSEQRVLYVLEQLDAIAKSLADANSIANAASIRSSSSATSALLGSVNTRKPTEAVSKATLLSLISRSAENIVRHPNVFITAPVLKSYVELQNLLHQPASFPEVFDLYARKPTPTATGNSKVKYTSPNPKSLNAAIDKDTANIALSSAITAHDLTLTLAVLEKAFAAPAYARAKALRQGAVPGTVLAIAPMVAYGLSTQFSAWQTMLDPATATNMAFAGIMTYTFAVGTVGYVAITTTNDQMDRVTWAQGVPLWERWIREEERAALDRVAGAWGFKDREKRGDEEGEDWEKLKETCGLKGMVLDKVELMEGME
ncbi:hypothetical protein AMS68_007224 [Peltaster fructicola]|uniref:Uncharacterized protein n=1 Tax=Peltaster fructicola TaxID=286661 RepID=A0A6H0Y3W0_9PEZI|nr:hypothetical protein AMS68_007224 [Peltaster fructicola]